MKRLLLTKIPDRAVFAAELCILIVILVFAAILFPTATFAAVLFGVLYWQFFGVPARTPKRRRPPESHDGDAGVPVAPEPHDPRLVGAIAKDLPLD